MNRELEQNQEAVTNQIDLHENKQKSLLDQAIEATKKTERNRAQELLEAIVGEALKGTITWNKNLTITIKQATKLIDDLLSRQLAAIMHDNEFLKLEGSWRGLHYLVKNSETNESLRIHVLNISKNELNNDLEKAAEFDCSEIFKKVYTSEFDMPGGKPYGALLGDYQFTRHPDDISLLQKMSQVAAAAFAPFIAAADPDLFGFDDWTELRKPRDLAEIFQDASYVKWNSFRESEDARFVTLTLPRVLARLPYGVNTSPVGTFTYEEAPLGNVEGNIVRRELEHKHYCWMNAAYALGTRLTNAFAQYGWCTAIRGEEGGGKVENLPADIFTSMDGDRDLKCPTEVGIPGRRDFEFSKLGFLPLCHYKDTDYAVFFGAQTVQKPKQYNRSDATANAAISARLPYVLATSRFAHYLKIMATGKIGAFMEVNDVENWLNRWIQNYVMVNANASQEQKARYPLADARVRVEAVPGKPGVYNAVGWLRPWLQMEELNASLRTVAEIPQGKE